MLTSLAVRLMYQPGPMTNAKMAAAARDLNIPLSTARRWLQRFNERGTLRRASGSGGVSKYGSEFMAELVSTARDLNYQGSRRQVAAVMTEKGFAASASSVQRITQREGWAHRKLQTSPMLSAAHREARNKWCLARVREAAEEEAARARGKYVVHVHLDEKWFHSQRVGGMLYMPADASVPVQRLFSKTQVPKVMFIAAVARPVVDKAKKIAFDGQLGFFPIVMRDHYRSNSKLGVCGDEYYYNITMNGERFHSFLTKTLMPTIYAKCAWAHKVVVQFDGAGGHGIGSNGALLTKLNLLASQKAAREGKPSIEFRKQPAQSPDLNVLDLGAWHSLQTAVDVVKYSQAGEGKMETRIVVACVKAWEATWQAPAKLASLFDYLETKIWPEIVKYRGGNKYKMPHRSAEARKEFAALSDTLTAELSGVKANSDDDKAANYVDRRALMAYLGKYIIYDAPVEKKLPLGQHPEEPSAKRARTVTVPRRTVVEYSDDDECNACDDDEDSDSDDEDEDSYVPNADAPLDLNDREVMGCICNHNKSNSGNRAAKIKCDRCLLWFHQVCVLRGRVLPKVEESFLCPRCATASKNEHAAAARALRMSAKGSNK